MHWTLGIDTASTSLHIALLQDGKPFLSTSKMVLNSHAEHITPLIQSFLKQAEISAQEISHVGAVVGPGSFTGLRIGLSFIKGMFVSGGTKVRALNTFEVTAQSLGVPSSTLGIALDARQDNLFWATYSKSDRGIQEIQSPIKISKELFYNDAISEVDAIYFDTMGFSNSTLFDNLASMPQSVSLQSLVLSKGIAAAQLAYDSVEDESVWSEAVDVYPNYMQESYAERTRKSAS